MKVTMNLAQAQVNHVQNKSQRVSFGEQEGFEPVEVKRYSNYAGLKKELYELNKQKTIYKLLPFLNRKPSYEVVKSYGDIDVRIAGEWQTPGDILQESCSVIKNKISKLKQAALNKKYKNLL